MPLGGAGGGVSNYLALTDTSASYAGQARKFPKVNAGETALEFADGAHLIALLEALSAQTWNQQFNNHVKNGSYKSWSAGAAAAPDGWAVAGAGVAIAREATIIRIGEYSAKLTRAGADVILYQAAISPIDADTNTYWRGRIVTVGCWVYATVADRAKLTISDAVVNTDSALHPGDSAWHFLTATATLNAAAITVTLYFQVITGDTDVYFDGAILVEGPICPAFAPKAAEHVAGWMDWTPTVTDDADLSGYTTARFYRIGKLCHFVFTAENKNVTTGGRIKITLPFTPSANDYTVGPNLVHNGTAWVGMVYAAVRAGGDLEVWKNAAGGAWAGTETGVYIRVSGFYEIA